MDTILDNTLGENYFDTRALADFVCVPPQVSALGHWVQRRREVEFAVQQQLVDLTEHERVLTIEEERVLELKP